MLARQRGTLRSAVATAVPLEESARGVTPARRALRTMRPVACSAGQQRKRWEIAGRCHHALQDTRFLLPMVLRRLNTSGSLQDAAREAMPALPIRRSPLKNARN